LPRVINQSGNRFHRLAEFYPLTVDHDRDEAIVALAVRRIGAQSIKRLEHFAGDIGLIGWILVAEFVGIGRAMSRASAMTVPRST
jgi:hypothetical protein